MSRLLLDKSYKYGVIQYKSDGMVSICKNSQLHTGQFDKVGASVSIMKMRVYYASQTFTHVHWPLNRSF